MPDQIGCEPLQRCLAVVCNRQDGQALGAVVGWGGQAGLVRLGASLESAVDRPAIPGMDLPGVSPQLFALLVASAGRSRILRWWFRWRHLGSTVSATELMSQGVVPGPALGKRLRHLRDARLRQERC